MIRRLFTLPLGFLLLLTFVSALNIQYAKTTFFDSQYFYEKLEEIEIYNFLSEDLITAVLSDLYDANKIPLDQKLIQDSLKQVITSEWLQSESEATIGGLVKYIVGDSDEFTISIYLNDRIELLFFQIKLIIANSEFYKLAITPKIQDQFIENLPDLFIGLTKKEELNKSVSQMFPTEWLREETENGIDQLEMYLLGEKDNLEITINLKERMPFVSDELKSLLLPVDLSSEPSKSEKLVEGMFLHSLNNFVYPESIPLLLHPTQSEIEKIVSDTITTSWTKEQISILVDGFIKYISGNSNDTVVIISLNQIKPSITEHLLSLTEEKTRNIIATLRECTFGESFAFHTRMYKGFHVPACVPMGVSKDQLLEIYISSFKNELEFALDENIPDTFEIEIISSNNKSMVEMRRFIHDGLIFTEKDVDGYINQNIGTEALSIGEIKRFINDTSLFRYDEKLLRRDIPLYIDQEYVDIIRTTIWVFKKLPFLEYTPSILLILLIGFIGGTNWISRFWWGLGYILIISCILLGLVFVIKDNISSIISIPKSLLDDSFVVTNTIINTKIDLVIHNLTHNYFQEIVRYLQDFVIGIISILFVVSVLWIPFYVKNRRTRVEL
ncbi:MAG: hypothetical protein FI728_03320 [SAR202 cluster bacterium]|nr:hypothetical protein [SAR202 cluster bacterium]|tara:strand:- start:128 stop:1963 length:1836 start_codon:yes stop_codon:yes gene_type:complete